MVDYAGGAVVKQLQAEHAVWLAKKYPGQLPIFPAAGLVEESGELMRALLKCQQANGGKHPDPRYLDTDWNDLIVDAIGDCGLFVCSLCNTTGWGFDTLLFEAKLMLPAPREAFLATAKLCLWAAHVCEEPKSRGLVLCYVAELLRICSTWNVDFNEAVLKTWEVVRCR
jgi:hypothetical protein